MNRPKPTHLKLIQGNPGGRKLNTSEPVAPPISAMPKPPKYLSKDARKEWRHCAPLLRDAGLLTKFDLDAFARLCQIKARLAEAEAGLDKFGMLVKSPNGYPQQSIYLSIVNNLSRQLMGVLAEFGMTPSSRSRIEIDKRGGNDDAFEAFLRSGED